VPVSGGGFGNCGRALLAKEYPGRWRKADQTANNPWLTWGLARPRLRGIGEAKNRKGGFSSEKISANVAVQ